MKKETAEQIHTVCDILLGCGPWDRDFQLLVKDSVLERAATLDGEEEAARALALSKRVEALPGDDAPATLDEEESMRADARKLAEDMAFDFEDQGDEESLLPFPESDYCPDCSYHQDDHDMRAMNARGGVGACPVPDKEAGFARVTALVVAFGLSFSGTLLAVVLSAGGK